MTTIHNTLEARRCKPREHRIGLHERLVDALAEVSEAAAELAELTSSDPVYGGTGGTDLRHHMEAAALSLRAALRANPADEEGNLR